MIGKETKNKLLIAQCSEITEHNVYAKLAKAIKGAHNKKVLQDISNDELRHYNIWKKYTKEDVKPSKFKLWKYYLISRIFGLTFGIKLMEKGEELAQATYDNIAKVLPVAKKIEEDENRHEKALIALIDEEKLKYVSSVVLGLNDALVELTGALAGFTLALQKTRIVAVAGLITGIAASLSMAVSEYLSSIHEEKGEKNPFKASVYTGFAYLLTVLFLIFPFLLLPNVFISLGWTLANAIIVILIFTYYVSVAKDLSFRKRFIEMALISLGVAALSFGIGYLVRILFGIEI
jgi:VIT1/CCC1 family predicted Fe2+/Mn2+ transporter